MFRTSMEMELNSIPCIRMSTIFILSNVRFECVWTCRERCFGCITYPFNISIFLVGIGRCELILLNIILVCVISHISTHINWRTSFIGACLISWKGSPISSILTVTVIKDNFWWGLASISNDCYALGGNRLYLSPVTIVYKVFFS